MPDAEVFLDALHDVLARHPAARRRLRVKFAGPFDSGVEDRAVALGLRGIVEFRGPVSHAESRALQRAADLLLLWKPRGTPTMVPGKLYEYLDAGRPVLAVLEAGDEAARLAVDAGAERVSPGDRAGIAAALERRWAGWMRGERPEASRPTWLDDHARPRLAARLAGLLDTLAEGSA
jgi:glycosyltransferase involved in cell wall biosynthesis